MAAFVWDKLNFFLKSSVGGTGRIVRLRTANQVGHGR